MSKLFSGRFVFTVVCAVLLFHGTISGKFPPDKVLDIIKDVVIFYFIVKQTLTKPEVTK
jgi:hypothetical protein